MIAVAKAEQERKAERQSWPSSRQRSTASGSPAARARSVIWMTT
jgi:hypothetical protein